MEEFREVFDATMYIEIYYHFDSKLMSFVFCAYKSLPQFSDVCHIYLGEKQIL